MIGSRTTPPPWTIPPGKLPCPPGNSHLGQLPPLNNSHLELLYCPQIITPRQLQPIAMAITNYNFFMTIFCFFSMAQLYSFCAFCAFWVHSKICFRKGRRCCRKKVRKRKICSNVFNLTKKWFHSTKISNQSSMFIYLFIYFCTSSFLVLIILQPEIVKLNVTKSYILDVVGVIALV